MLCLSILSVAVFVSGYSGHAGYVNVDQNHWTYTSDCYTKPAYVMQGKRGFFGDW